MARECQDLVDAGRQYRIPDDFRATKIDELYLVAGLARSGNHMLISAIIENRAARNVIFLNNVKPRLYYVDPQSCDDVAIRKIAEKCLTSRDNYRGSKFSPAVRSLLASEKTGRRFLAGKMKSANVVILSMENVFAERLRRMDKCIFPNVGRTERVVVIRDIYNLFASRAKSEEQLVPTGNPYDYRTDETTIEYWLDNVRAKDLTQFVYNRFLQDPAEYLPKFLKSIGITATSGVSLPEYNKFGITKGSSFGKDSGFTDRWQECDTPLMRRILADQTILDICKAEFGFSPKTVSGSGEFRAASRHVVLIMVALLIVLLVVVVVWMCRDSLRVAFRRVLA